MCVSLLSVLVVLKQCFFSFLHYVLVYLFIFLLLCHVCYLFCVYFVYDSCTNNNIMWAALAAGQPICFPAIIAVFSHFFVA